jgi:hypothetical protein
MRGDGWPLSVGYDSAFYSSTEVFGGSDFDESGGVEEGDDDGEDGKIVDAIRKREKARMRWRGSADGDDDDDGGEEKNGGDDDEGDEPLTFLVIERLTNRRNDGGGWDVDSKLFRL